MTARLIEKDSPTWRHLRRHIETRIATLQKQLEAPLDGVETAMIRGRIAELRALLREVEPADRDPATEIGAPVY